MTPALSHGTLPTERPLIFAIVDYLMWTLSVIPFSEPRACEQKHLCIAHPSSLWPSAQHGLTEQQTT